jgi:hypothetical protein
MSGHIGLMPTWFLLIATLVPDDGQLLLLLGLSSSSWPPTGHRAEAGADEAPALPFRYRQAESSWTQKYPTI